jgi:hypothetical protein
MDAERADVHFRTRTELGRHLGRFFSARRRATGQPPVLAADWIGDLLLLDDLVPAGTRRLVLDEMRSPGAESWTCGLPHNALDDALAIRAAFMADRPEA